MLGKIKIFFRLILLLFIQTIIKANELNDNKYIFSIYPSLDQENPYFYALTQNKLIVIDSTLGENCQIIDIKIPDEYIYEDISSISLIDDIFLVKTCIGPNKLMEIQNKKKESFLYIYTDFSKIKFCYSTKIKNPFINLVHPEEYIIITYWVENGNNSDRYIHKCILFYPESNTFSQVFTLSSGNIFPIDRHYPEKCVTFRNVDIFCVIHYSPENSDETHILANHYVIETNYLKINSNNNAASDIIYLVLSNTQLSQNSVHRLISLGKRSKISIRGYGDEYITVLHKNDWNGNGMTLLLYSSYVNKHQIRTSYIPYYESLNIFYGINIKDDYIHQNLFNYLILNKDELIVILIKKEIGMSLLLTKFNISDSESKKLHIGFKDLSKYTYIRNDICEEPKYLQSTYINSYINYNNNDKKIIDENKDKKFFKFQKDIGVSISCSENNKVTYLFKKIGLPQCLNTLDEINGNNVHNLKFKDSHTEVIFDLYGDPNLFSLRNVEINFNISNIFNFLFLMQIKSKGEDNFQNIKFNQDYNNVTHIKFIRKYNLSTKSPIVLQYRVRKNGIIKNYYASKLESDICELSFEVTSGAKCGIDFCQLCENLTICQICDNVKNLDLIKDEEKNSETYGKCICDEKKGFKKMPNKIFNMCICKENYSFYKDRYLCKSNEELKNMPTYIDEKEEITGIDIYEDCYKTCSKCSKGGLSDEEQNCDECIDGYFLEGNNCIKKDICLLDKKIWFNLGKYIFYFVKIDKCVFIFDENTMFFISNKENCLNLTNNPKNTYSYISNCLNDARIDSELNYINFINNAKEYIPYANNITIYKYIEEEKIYFHLYNNEMEYNNLSSIYFRKNEKIDLLIFKVDIKRKDTISTQVEYQFYNQTPEYIYKKIDINEYLYKKRINQLESDDIDNHYEFIYLDLPISLSQEKIDKIKELSKANIDAFNSSSEFYIDICSKYTTPNHDDIYLQERREEYYPDEKFCEEKCEFVKFNINNYKITCKCIPKTSTDYFDKITFKYNDKSEKFKKKIFAPNLEVMECLPIIAKTLTRNFGFFLTFLFLFIFFFLFLMKIFEDCFKNNVQKIENNQNPQISNESSLNSSELQKNDVTFNTDSLHISFQNNNILENNVVSDVGVTEGTKNDKPFLSPIITNPKDDSNLILSDNAPNKNNLSFKQNTLNNKNNNNNNNDNNNNDNNNNKGLSKDSSNNKSSQKIDCQMDLNFNLNKNANENKNISQEVSKNINHEKENDVKFTSQINGDKRKEDNNIINKKKESNKYDYDIDSHNSSNLIKSSKDNITKSQLVDSETSKDQNEFNKEIPEENIKVNEEKQNTNSIIPKRNNYIFNDNDFSANPPKRMSQISFINDDETERDFYIKNDIKTESDESKKSENNKINYRIYINDIFIKRSIRLLFISLYIFMNFIFAFKMEIVQAIINLNFWIFLIIFVIPLLVSFILLLIKKCMSKNIHNCCKKNINSIVINGTFITFFLTFNCILVTSYCAIYPNSISKLGVNIILSIFNSFFFSFVCYLLGILLKNSFLKKLSKVFNPLNLSGIKLIRYLKFITSG